jgi:hypothetical protein
MDLSLINLAYDIDQLKLGKPVLVRQQDITHRFRRFYDSAQNASDRVGLFHCGNNLTVHEGHFCYWPFWCGYPEVIYLD